MELLIEAYRILKPNGSVSIMHLRSDISTPRGPSLDIRPSLQQCEKWSIGAGFKNVSHVPLDGGCPFHFGLIAIK